MDGSGFRHNCCRRVRGFAGRRRTHSSSRKPSIGLNMRSVFIVCQCSAFLSASLLVAQQPAATSDGVPGGSISGQVVLATGKTPVSDATVRARSGTKTSEAKADAQGHYTLKDVAPGAVTVVASRPPGQAGPPVSASRRIQLGPAQDLIAIDLQMPTPPQIQGRV